MDGLLQSRKRLCRTLRLCSKRLYGQAFTLVYGPGAGDDAGAEEHVDDGVRDAVEVRQALNEQRGVVSALSVAVLQNTVHVQQVVHEVRTPAEHERYHQSVNQSINKSTKSVHRTQHRENTEIYICIDKCSVLHIGKATIVNQFHIKDIPLPLVSSYRDLGITVAKDLSPTVL